MSTTTTTTTTRDRGDRYGPMEWAQKSDWFIFLVLAHLLVPDKGLLNGCCYCCKYVNKIRPDTYIGRPIIKEK